MWTTLVLSTNNSAFGGGNTLTITGNLTNEASGTFQLFGPGDMATIGSLSNSGFADVEGGSTLKITGAVGNSGSMYTSFNGTGGNTLTITGMLTNSGAFELLGSGDMASIGNGVLNNGGALIDAANGSSLNIIGDVTNNGNMGSTFFSFQTGGSTLNITGNLTNNGGFGWLGAGDIGGITGNVINNDGFTVLGSDAHTIGGTLTNNAGGFFDIDNQSTLHITGNVSNFAGELLVTLASTLTQATSAAR